MVAIRILTAFLLLPAVAGCSQERSTKTELILVADTDIPDVDSIRFEVTAQREAGEHGEVTLPRADAGPTVLTVVHDKRSLGPLTITAHALAGERVRATRAHSTSFVTGEARFVPLHLVRACVDAQCGDGETCSEIGCIPVSVPPEHLPSVEGPPELPPSGGDGAVDTPDAATPGPRDAALPDAAVPDAGPTLCDGRVVDFERDPLNCGSCGHVCPDGAPRNTMMACVDGRCSTSSLVCKPYYADCYSLVGGCESHLLTDDNCGACYRDCYYYLHCATEGPNIGKCVY